MVIRGTIRTKNPLMKGVLSTAYSVSKLQAFIHFEIHPGTEFQAMQRVVK